MIRRGIALIMAMIMMALCCAGALADSGLPAGFLAQTENGVYFKLDDMLIRVDGEEAELAGNGSISAVAALGDTAYCLQYGEDNALDLVQYAPGSESKVLYEFQATDRVGNLTVHGTELFLLLNDQLHVVYPSNGMCIKLANTAIAEYVWLNGMIYFAAKDETVEHTMDSLLGGDKVVKAGGVLYSLDVNTGSMVKLLDTGVEDLRAGGDLLYFHDLTDAYVMGSDTEEWLEGRVYSMDPATKQKTCAVEGYDWGFYPTKNGLVIYTAEGVSRVNADGTLTTLLQPQGVINAISTDEAVFVFDQTENVLYRYDGQLDVVAASRLGALLTENGKTVQDVVVPEISAEPTAEATAEPAVEATAEATAEAATAEPTAEPTQQPTQTPTAEPTAAPTVKPTAEPTAKPTEKPSNDNAMDGSYIFPDSDKKKLTKEEIKKVDKKWWSYGRNEIYARHGYYFGEGSKYQEYFDQKSWYWAGDFSTSELNSIEWYNMQLLKEMEGITGSESKPGSGDSSYIFANSSKKKLTRKQILAVDKSLWPYARNEIYARHGYSFKTAKYRNYFKKKSWYKEGGFSTGDLNSVEWYNMDLLKQMEKEYGVK